MGKKYSVDRGERVNRSYVQAILFLLVCYNY